jgi:KRAB domain-containing zinc finger protein
MVTMQRLTDKQLLALKKPKKSHDPSSLECQLCGEHCTSVEYLQQHVDLHSTPLSGEIKCAFLQCTRIFSSSTELKQHKKTHFVFSRVSCHFCGKLFCRKINLKVHIKRHITERSYVCDFPGCSFSAWFPDHLIFHKKMVHTSILYTCLLCGKDIKSIDCYQSHVASHNTEKPGIYKCLVRRCKKLCKDGDELKKHIKKVHEDVKKFQCNECGTRCVSKERLISHLLCHSDEKPFKCNVLGCTFSTKRSNTLIIHKKSVHTDVNFTCCYCDKMFKRQDRFKLHMENHKTDTPGVFKCLRVGCTMTFTETLELRKHTMDAHEGTKRYECQTCGQSTSSSSHLNRHIMRKHQNGKMTCMIPGCWYTCDNSQEMEIHRTSEHASYVFTSCHLCGKEYYSEALFQKHVEAHKTKKEGVFKCLDWKCKKTFTVPLDLMTHFKEHSGINKECDVPNCTFLSKSHRELQSHMATVHLISLQHCQLCGAGFEQSILLKRHLKRHETAKPGIIKCLKLKCKKTFTSGAQLKKHVKSHDNKPSRNRNSSCSNSEVSNDNHSTITDCEKTIKIEGPESPVHENNHEITPGDFEYHECKQAFNLATDSEQHAARHVETGEGQHVLVFKDESEELPAE